MTGPVERVPLTELITEWELRRCGPGMAGLGLNEQRWLLAELRASRAREQGLQQRIDKALAECDGLAKIIQSFTSDGDARSTAGGAACAIAAVRAALTGTEEETGG